MAPKEVDDLTPPVAGGLRFLGLHACLFALAFAVRVVHVLESRALPFFDSLVNDAASYDAWARQIAAGDWLGSEVFYQAPLYPYSMAVLYSLAGRDLLILRLVQAFLGAAGCTALALAGQRFFDRRTGWIAGFMLAVYPPAIFFDALIQKAVLDGLLGALLLLGLAHVQSRPTVARVAWVGVALGFFCLSRENVLLVVPLVGLWFWLSAPRAHSRARRLVPVGVLAAAMLAVLLPVAIRNRYVGGEWALTTSQAGVNFWIGNHAGASGTYAPLRPGRGDTRHERRDATELAEQALGRDLTPAEVSAHWFRGAVADIAGGPLAWLGLMGRKLALTLNWYEVPDTEDIYFYERTCRLIRWLGSVWHFGVLLPLAALGAVASWPRRRELGILYVLFGGVLLAVVLFFVLGRYRYPLVPILILFAAAGVEALIRPERRRALRRWPAAVLAVPAALVAGWPINARESQFSASYNNAGVAYSQRGDLTEALASLDEATLALPGFLPTEISRGATLKKMGRLEEAEAAFRRAAELAPDDPAPLTLLGMTVLSRGDVPAARSCFERVLSRWPDAPEALNGLGHVLLLEHENRRALEHIRRAAELVPGDARLALDLVVLLCALPDEDLRDGPLALRIARRVVRQTAEEDAGALDALGMALAECGRFEEAQEAARRALDIAQANGVEDQARIIRARLKQYESGQPSRFGAW